MLGISRVGRIIAASCLVLLNAWTADADEPIVAFQPLADIKPKDFSDTHPGRPIDPLLEEILEKWQQANSQIERLDAEFTYVESDRVFDGDDVARGKGWLSVDIFGRGIVILQPTEVETRNRKDIPRPKGRAAFDDLPLRVPSVRYCWTGSELILVNEESREYEAVSLAQTDRPLNYSPVRPPPLPEEVGRPYEQVKGELIADTPTANKPLSSNDKPEKKHKPSRTRSPTLGEAALGLVVGIVLSVALANVDFSDFGRHLETAAYESPVAPFLLPMPLQELKSRYRISVRKQTETEVQLEFQAKSDKPLYKTVYLQLNRQDYRPKALKLFDWSGDRSQLGIFRNIRINMPPSGKFADLGRPDLYGYPRPVAPE